MQMREDDEVFQRVLGVIGGIGDVRGFHGQHDGSWLTGKGHVRYTWSTLPIHFLISRFTTDQLITIPVQASPLGINFLADYMLPS